MSAPRPTVAERPADDAMDVDGVVAAAAACPAVSSLSGGLFGEVATYLPGRRVVGVRANDTDVEIHIVARRGYPLRHVTAQIAAAVEALIGERRLTVAVDDLDIDLPDAAGSWNPSPRSESEQP